MTGIEYGGTPEAGYRHEVATVVDGVMAAAMCASVRGHDTIAVAGTPNEVIAGLINLIGWVGENESRLLSAEWLTFMTDLHAHLNGRDWPSCRALMGAALFGAPELGVPSLGVATNGFVELCSSSDGTLGSVSEGAVPGLREAPNGSAELRSSADGTFYFLKVLSSRGARRVARHALEAT